MLPTKTTPVFEYKNITKGIRGGILTTRAGKVFTPTFMPDGTRGAVKSLTPEMVESTGIQVVLANTYHLHLEPSEEVIAKLGGLHKFANREGPMLTDSGGFQVFSLAHANKITEEGVTFKDPKTGNTIFLSPEKSIQIQMKLGADMIVVLDDVTALDAKGKDRTLEAFERTHRWLGRNIAEFKKLTKDMATPSSSSHIQADARQGTGKQHSKTYVQYGERAAEPVTQSGIASVNSDTNSVGGQVGTVNMRGRPLLFGVVQGGLDKKLRKKSLELVQASEVDGIAIGGLSVGESRTEMHEMLNYLAGLYDDSPRPRFLLGVGDPTDVRFGIEHGIDMFDCVLPTRNACHATVWVTGDKRLHLTNAKFATDKSPIDESCDCYTCKQGFSKGFLRHQFKVGEPLAGTLASIHNIRYLERICESYR